MVDDQIGHHVQSEVIGDPYCCAQLFFRRLACTLVEKSGVQGEIVRGGIEALRASNSLYGIDEDPVKSQVDGSGQVRLPLREPAGQSGKEIVNPHGSRGYMRRSLVAAPRTRGRGSYFSRI